MSALILTFSPQEKGQLWRRVEISPARVANPAAKWF